MVTHTQALTAWDNITQPTKWAIKKELVGEKMVGLVSHRVPSHVYKKPSFPFQIAMESMRYQNDFFPLISHMSQINVYFNHLRSKQFDRKTYIRIKLLFMQILPHIPADDLDERYQTLFEYFTFGDKYTPINKFNGRMFFSVLHE